MGDTLPVALAITAIGMTLLFLALGLFYGLLASLTRVVRDRDAGSQVLADAPPADTASVQSDGAAAARLRAAAVAVALARAESEAGAVGGAERREVPAAGWWALHHGRRMAAPPSPWRGR